MEKFTFIFVKITSVIIKYNTVIRVRKEYNYHELKTQNIKEN